MIDAFEARLAQFLSNALQSVAEIHGVSRAVDGQPAPVPTASSLELRLLNASPDEDLGEDAMRVLGPKGSRRLRPNLRLSGDVQIELEIGVAKSASDRTAQRTNQLRALDAVLLTLNGPDVRSGTAFGNAEDQGFALDGFRLVSVESKTDTSTDFRRFSLTYRYSGDFWPVQPTITGPAIADVQLRLAAQVAASARDLQARAGGPDLSWPLRLDLRALGGAAPRLIALLVDGPGSLVGDTTDLPPNAAAFFPDAKGAFLLTYRPPTAQSGMAIARLAFQLRDPDRATVELGEVSVTVTG